ncbi:hypothetical protein L208DRAFT_1412200 [Tricholoma matsutake]|nr:hypothetical protein L208DRAFT_1412200 [Tricholoma matsutake 945]
MTEAMGTTNDQQLAGGHEPGTTVKDRTRTTTTRDNNNGEGWEQRGTTTMTTTTTRDNNDDRLTITGNREKKGQHHIGNGPKQRASRRLGHR